MKVEERTFRFFEVSFYIMAIALIVLVSIVLYFVGEKPKMCVENKYDINGDGEVNVFDITTEIEKINEIREYVENQDTREKQMEFSD